LADSTALLEEVVHGLAINIAKRPANYTDVVLMPQLSRDIGERL
jgi:hypothetical protein